LLSSSPFAFWDVTSSFCIHTDAHFDCVDIISNISWGAEVSIWDQGYSVTPFAFSSCFGSAKSNGVQIEARWEFSSKVTSELFWVAELFGEEWSLARWNLWWFGIIFHP
jgi:hypothetical protein